MLSLSVGTLLPYISDYLSAVSLPSSSTMQALLSSLSLSPFIHAAPVHSRHARPNIPLLASHSYFSLSSPPSSHLPLLYGLFSSCVSFTGMACKQYGNRLLISPTRSGSISMSMLLVTLFQGLESDTLNFRAPHMCVCYPSCHLPPTVYLSHIISCSVFHLCLPACTC
jgi:hypothetical protein